ncbi:hypothetical protein C0585_02180 [Candidatus Woesearchaeota archaeon]|nr:MAG: hypothetical protein C0585_02180 [Candidatus Woesearchaeota archaeon]
MRIKLFDFIRLIIPLNSKNKSDLMNISNFINDENLKTVKRLLKMKKAGISYESLGTSHNFLNFTNYPHITIISDDNEVKDFVDKLNKDMREKIDIESFKQFSIKADDKIRSLIAPNIRGMDNIKLACALQLFSEQKTHILLLGDPGTGKTDIIRSTSELHPKTSFGLGSGTSKAGLSIAFKGDEKILGLLPLADEGLCCIDELNLMKQEDRASLYNAMEKGFITYDKANKHLKIDARVSILATANPKGDKFAGWMIDTLKKQLPFDSALLTRFHLMFIVRKPDIDEFVEITKHILKGDKKKEFESNKDFVKRYVQHAKEIDVEVPKSFEK